MQHHLNSVTSSYSPPSSDNSLPDPSSDNSLPFSVTPGIQVNLEQQDPIDFFRLLFDDKVFTLIYDQTQLYITQYFEDNEEFLRNHPNARALELKKHPLMKKDIDVFLSLIIGMGIVGLPSMR